MTEENNLITSPLCHIQYMALRHKVRNKPGDEEATVYTVRVEPVEANSEKAKAFKDAVAKVNKNIISTKHASQPGSFTVKASTQWFPKVIDDSGELLTQDQMPTFYPGSKGKAVITVKPNKTNPLGGNINLIGVALTEMELTDKPEGNDGTSDIVDRLRESLGR